MAPINRHSILLGFRGYFRGFRAVACRIAFDLRGPPRGVFKGRTPRYMFRCPQPLVRGGLLSNSTSTERSFLFAGLGACRRQPCGQIAPEFPSCVTGMVLTSGRVRSVPPGPRDPVLSNWLTRSCYLSPRPPSSRKLARHPTDVL